MIKRYFIHALIALNVLMFVGCQVMPELAGLLAHYQPQHPHYRHWQWFSSLFLHKDIMHLLMNMYALWLFGTPLLQTWGTRRFALLYFGSGLAGSLLDTAWHSWQIEQTIQTLANGASRQWVWRQLEAGTMQAPMAFWQALNSHSIGASGAVFGLLAAFSLRFADVRLSLFLIPVSFRAKYFAMALVGYEIFAQISGISVFGANINHLAHIGGALLGWALAAWWKMRPRRRLRMVKS